MKRTSYMHRSFSLRNKAGRPAKGARLREREAVQLSLSSFLRASAATALLFWILLCGVPLHAQAPEVGLHLGGALYGGDLHPGEVQLSQIRPAGGLFYRQKLSESISLRANLLLGALKGSDNEPPDELAEQRNFNFSTNFGEVSIAMEYYLLGPASKYARIKPAPYVFVGLGAMVFSGHDEPTAEFSSFQPVLPFGLGLKLPTSRSSSIGIQLGIRKTFFDYLDNISAKDFERKDYNYGDRYSTDWYHYIGLSFSYTIYSLKCPFPIERPDRIY